jgi:DNA-binding transcriptional LysR family regulator
MELRHLRYFVAIAEEQSFTRAAERLWIAQPGLSTQIRRLERELGVKLLDRHTRGVDLTDAGEVFLERARATLAAAETAYATGRDLEAGVVGSIRLGIDAAASWPHAPALLDVFGRDRPEVEMTVVQALGGTLMRDLRDGRLEAVVAPSAFAAPELHRLRLGRDPWLVLAGASHRLAAADGPVDARELRGERLVVTGHRDGTGYDRVVLEMLAGRDVVPETRRGGAGPALFAGVVSGDAVALTTSPADATRGMVARPLAPPAMVEFALLWRDATPAPALARFIDCAATPVSPVRIEHALDRLPARAA